MRLEERQTRRFTQNYFQPDAYHFCLETVIAAERVASSSPAPKRIADVGAGCGIFGLELLHAFPEARLDAIEVQPDFASYFETNRRLVPAPDRATFHCADARNFARQSPERFELIVANLPFFEPHESRLSASTIRNNCRFLLNGDASELIRAISELLRPNGSAYVLSREGPLRRALIPPALRWTETVWIRNSILVRFEKNG